MLPDLEKLQLIDFIWEQLDRPDPEIDKIWADEARARWQAYKDGTLKTVSYEEVMSKYKRS
jgi:putative addiction module component (TIGR02574 family)